MNDLTNSHFGYKNSFSFEGFNKENQKNENEKEDAEETDVKDGVSDFAPSPEIIPKNRTILANWLDAEYNSAFQYQPVRIMPEQCGEKGNGASGTDINDPIVVYEFLKKYIFILYEFNCEESVEKLILEEMEQALKEYFKNNDAGGADNYLDKVFEELKNEYLLNGSEYASKRLKFDIKEEVAAKRNGYAFISDIEDCYNNQKLSNFNN